LAVVALLAMLTVSGAAHAKEPAPATVDTLQVDLGVRYGLSFEKLDVNPWRLGWGGAIGYTRENAIYLGASFDYYDGEVKKYPADNYPDPTIGGNYWQALAQVGYDLRLSKRWLWRPKVGVGWATLNFNDCITTIDGVECAKTYTSETALVPALQLMFVTPVSFSLEARYVMLFNSVTIKHALVGGFGIGF